MARHEKISISVIRRLPRYYRFLGDLSRNGVLRISSKELSARMGLTASQIRQDLNCFGGFGQQGYGYNVDALHAEIGSILGISKIFPAIIVGAGNIGRAIAMNIGFENMGFKLTGIFDSSPDVIGMEIRGISVIDVSQLETFCKAHKPKIAVITVPQQAAPDIVDRLIKLGIESFWNFSHFDIAFNYPGIVVENVHLGDSLMTLCYMTNNLSALAAHQPQKAEK